MSAMDVVPLLKAPASWPPVVSATVAMILLAGLDLVGAIAAKEWARTQSPVALASGIVTMIAVFWIYASALQYAELVVVTLGWIVLLQVALVAVDRIRYGAQPTGGQWVAIGVVLAAQGYLVLSSSAAA
ncbi:MAG: hypothetical protein U0Q21_00875 [Dermatophilaceae bacterium]